MASESDPLKLSSPRIFLVRMMIFVVLCGLVAFVLMKQIEAAFMSNPGLNALIIGVLLIGVVLFGRGGLVGLVQAAVRRLQSRRRAA